MCNFGRRHHEDHFCEIILNLDQWFRRRLYLRTFLNYRSGDPCIKHSKTVCAILVEAIMRNNSVNYFEFEPVVQEEMSLKHGPPVQWSGTIYAILKEGIMETFM